MALDRALAPVEVVAALELFLTHARTPTVDQLMARLPGPDFPTGGTADFAEYNDGERGGKVKVRAKIEERSKYLLAVTELPYGVTTEALIADLRVNAPHVKASVVMPGHIGTSIVINSGKYFGREPKELTAEQLLEVRDRLARRGMDVSGASDDDLAAEIQRAVGTKWAGHQINQVTFVRPRRTMSQIGG